MKIEITIEDHNIGFSFYDDKGNVLLFEKLTDEEKLRILNSFADGFNFWKRFVKNIEE